MDPGRGPATPAPGCRLIVARMSEITISRIGPEVSPVPIFKTVRPMVADPHRAQVDLGTLGTSGSTLRHKLQSGGIPMAGNTHGCVLDHGTNRTSLGANHYIATTYFNQGVALLRQ